MQRDTGGFPTMYMFPYISHTQETKFSQNVMTKNHTNHTGVLVLMHAYISLVLDLGPLYSLIHIQ